MFMAETESVDSYKPKMSEESFMLFLKRKKAVQELIDTEVAYVRNLELVMKVEHRSETRSGHDAFYTFRNA